jgi:hypothetical protein
MMTPVMLVIDIDNHDAILLSASWRIDINRKYRELDRIVFKALSKAGTSQQERSEGKRRPKKRFIGKM